MYSKTLELKRTLDGYVASEENVIFDEQSSENIEPTGSLDDIDATGSRGPMGMPEYFNFSVTAANTSSNPIVAPVGSIDFEFTYVNAKTIRLTYRPTVLGTSILFDFKRVTYYDGAIEQQFVNNQMLSTNYVADDLIYTQSNDMQNSWLRQRNPDNTWSLCEYSIFASQSASRITLWIKWIYKDNPIAS